MYKTKVCPICKAEFSPKSARQKYCNRPVTRTCAVCGNTYESICSATYSKCCSKKCTNQYAHQQTVASYANTVKTCVLCGKKFTPKNNTQAVCPDQHFKNCVICGKQFPIKWRSGLNISDIAKTCSPECKTKATFANRTPETVARSQEKARQTMLERYGVDHPMYSPEIKAKVRKTNEERYGVTRFTQTAEYRQQAAATNQQKYGASWPMQTKEIQDKAKETLLEHYGVTNPMQSAELRNRIAKTYKANTGYDSPMHNPDVVDKIKKTNLDRYGAEHVLQAPEIKDKARATSIDRWGGIGLGSSAIREQVKATNLSKYGYENPASSPEVQAKIANTMLEKYGVEHHNASWDYRKSVMTTPEKAEDWKAFLENPESYINSHFDHKPNYKELSKALGVNDSTIQVHLARQGKYDLVQYTLSYIENDVVAALREINPNMIIQQHNRSLIGPYELDIYLPEYQIAIEVDPTITHNSTIAVHGDGKPKAPSYHKIKTDLCAKQGVFLFHLFGYDWTHKRDIVLSMLRNLVGSNSTQIYARKCEIREVSGKDAYEFLQLNHRQGGVHSKIRYGLYYNNELVSLMTFGKMRNTLGIGSEDLSDCWELVRFCNKLNTSVIGGASKLFKHFVTRNSPIRIRSFSDRAHTRGSLYETLGFTPIKQSNENYVWVSLKDDQAYNRVNAQKHNLKKFLGDNNIDLTKTEREIMESHGYVQVYDSGTITWEWRS